MKNRESKKKIIMDNQELNNQEKEKQELELIGDIRSLFRELIEEEKERYDTNTKRSIYPQSSVYVIKAESLYRKAVELEKIDDNYSTNELKDVISDEVDKVKRHEYKYQKNTMVPQAKSITKLQNLMHDATFHIQLYFYEVLKDIKID